MKDVLIIHYNTPELTAAAVRSLWNVSPGVRVTVFDNSDERPFGRDCPGGELDVVDNTRGQCVDFDAWLAGFPDRDPSVTNRYASARHCRSVDYCMEMFPEGFLLLDSDVLVRRDVAPLMDASFAWAGEVRPHPSKYGVTLPRVLPFVCWINTRMCLERGIRYCNPRKMYGLSRRRPDTAYDTGCWFYEACRKEGLPVREVAAGDYIVHLGHGSWKERDALAWLDRHRALWDVRQSAGRPSGTGCGT